MQSTFKFKILKCLIGEHHLNSFSSVKLRLENTAQRLDWLQQDKNAQNFFNWEITRNVNLRWKLICNFIWTSLHFISKSIKLEVFQLALFPKVENIPNVIVAIPCNWNRPFKTYKKVFLFCFEYISVFLTAFDNVKEQLTFVLYIKISQLLWQFNVV